MLSGIKKLTQNIGMQFFVCIVLTNLITAGLLVFTFINVTGESLIILGFGLGSVILLSLVLSRQLSEMAVEPYDALARAVVHVSDTTTNIAAPDINNLHAAKELTARLVRQVYDLASNGPGQNGGQQQDLSTDRILDKIALPVIIVGKNQKISAVNKTATEYFGLSEKDLIDKPAGEALNLLFSSEDTYESWITVAEKNKIQDQKTWQRVRIASKDGETLHQCDMTAYYNKGLDGDFESSLVLFDRSKQYGQDDDDLAFIALAVHELRTPLTVMRGYIEVFEDELGETLDPEMADFMKKLRASAQQLTTFVSNILNVARVEGNQLTLQLEKQDWAAVLKNCCVDMEIRAAVHGKTLEYSIADNLPPVAVDHISIYEVIQNLVDNAIKYSGEQTKIQIATKLNAEDHVQTTISDHGSGIPSGVMPHIFDKFYRNHRSRNQVGGTGLGLYLCKALIGAHGGEIWAKSKEGQGTTIGFTLVPYAQLAADRKGKGEPGIVRQANGWIKNHSFYRPE